VDLNKVKKTHSGEIKDSEKSHADEIKKILEELNTFERRTAEQEALK